MSLSEQLLGGFKTGMTRSSRRGGKDGAQKLWTLQNGYVTDQGDVVPRPGLQHVAGVAHSVGLYGADGSLHVFHSGTQGYVDPGNAMVKDHILRYPLAPTVASYDPNLTLNRYMLVPYSDTTDYSAPSFDDSDWASGYMPLGTSNRLDAVPYGFPAQIKTSWPLGSNVWFRGRFNLATPSDQTLSIFLDDAAQVYINGVLVFDQSTGSDEHYYWQQVIPASAFVTGQNVIAVKARGDIYGVNNYVSFMLTGQNADDTGSLGLVKVHFTGLILGRIYVAAEFANGLIRHYWLQEPANWLPGHIYGLGELVQPSIPNGYYYQSNTQSDVPVWQPGKSVSVGDKVQPTSPNGWYYVATDTSGSASTGDNEPSWPTEDGAQVFEGTDTTSVPSASANASVDPKAAAQYAYDQLIKNRYNLGSDT